MSNQADKPHARSSRHSRSQTDWLLTNRAFYAEFEPLPAHAGSIDHFYIMKDCGIMTADQRTFASSFVEIAFVSRNMPGSAGADPQIVVLEPSFGHKKRRRPFHGWIFGVKCHPTSIRPPKTAATHLLECQAQLARVMSNGVSLESVIDVLDQLSTDMASGPTRRNDGASRQRGDLLANVSELAEGLAQSNRTLQRRMKAETGLSPKRFLALERFSRAVHEVATPGASLASVADGLGFSDQSHLTREFQRHGGLSPGAFRRAWHGCRGQTVRFIQDTGSVLRLRLAVVAGDEAS